MERIIKDVMKTGYDQFFKKAKQTATAQSRTEKVRSLRRKTKEKSRFPLFQFALFLMFGVAGFIALENIYEIENQWKKIDISMSSAYAQDTPPVDAKPAPTAETVPAVTEAKKTADDSDYLFKLAERKKVLDQREEDLNRLAAEIEKQKNEIEEKIKKIEETRSKISSVLEEKIKTDDAKVDTLVQMYSNMKPQQVAKVFETLDEDLVIDILSRMKKKVAGDILNLVKPEKAQVFAERFTGYRTPASQ